VCEQPLPHADPTTAALRQQITDLEQRLANEQALQPQRQRITFELRARAEELRGRLRRVDQALAAIAGDAAELDAGLAERRAFVRGRIAQFLEGLRAAEPGRRMLLERRVRELEAEIAGLEDVLDPSAVAREVDSRLHFINENITQWAQRLALEHSEEGVRLDVRDLTVVANSRRGPIPLHRIGSAANQVGYHVVTHLALHRWFVEEDRPVPRFLFFDQPEQAYYPEDMPTGEREPTDRLTDLDQQRVENLYTFINAVTADLGGQLQVIVVGHWNPSAVDWFPAARVANWRHGAALVPREWQEAE